MKVALADLVEDLDLYPRTQVSSVNVSNLVAALQAGCALPTPVVDRESKRIIDGVHRCRAYRREFGPEASIEVEFQDFESDVEMFAAAVRLNTSHGLPLQEIEKRRIVLRMRDMGADPDAIATVLRVTPDRVQRLVFHSATTSIGGGKLKVEPLKRPVFHMRGQELTSAQAKAIRSAPGTAYALLVRQLREALQHSLIDSSDESLMGGLEALKDELAVFLSKSEAG